MNMCLKGLEHLHFRKLGRRTQKVLYYELESIGANFGASTFKEFAQFYFTVSPKYFSNRHYYNCRLVLIVKLSYRNSMIYNVMQQK